MNYLLDNNHWSAIQRNDPIVIAHMQSLPEEARIFMPVIVQGELLAGIELAASEAKKEELRRLYERVLAQATEILPVTSEVAEWYARIFAQLRRKGKPIPINDIWIAAIALAYGLILVTSDEHFQHIDGLQVEDWTKPEQSD
jgi:predicted nucleic acid-binding protein